MKTQNNDVLVTGTVVGEPEFSHEVFGESFYIVHLDSKRRSGASDVLPVIISERLISINEIKSGTYLKVTQGAFRSMNKQVSENKSRLLLFVFAQDVSTTDDLEEDMNDITLHGFLCKRPVYRTTPNGREITDLLVAVNRDYGKSDYIPCICWGRNAKYASTWEVGDEVELTGRIQSREYSKKLSEDGLVKERRTAYEVSVSRFEKIAEVGEC